MKQQDFINKIKDGAIQCYKKYEILPSLTIAQAILESAWGESSLTKEANNLFGIKTGGGWTGKKILKRTAEYDPLGNKYYTDAWFRKYDNWNDSILDHAEFLTKARYEKIRQAKDYKEACNQVEACGYATAPNYAEVLIDIIESYKLYQYDSVTSSVPASTDKAAKKYYIVKKGDNLTKIAKEYNTTVDELVRLNKIKNSNSIFVGQKLLIK